MAGIRCEMPTHNCFRRQLESNRRNIRLEDHDINTCASVWRIRTSGQPNWHSWELYSERTQRIYCTASILVTVLAHFWGLTHKCSFRWILADSQVAISRVVLVTQHDYSPRVQPDNCDYLSLITDLFRKPRRPISTAWMKATKTPTLNMSSYLHIRRLVLITITIISYIYITIYAIFCHIWTMFSIYTLNMC